PVILDEIDEMERTGWMKPIIPGGFTGYAHTADQLRNELAAAGLELGSLVNLEGIAAALSDVDERMDDPGRRAFLLDTLRAVESEPDLLGTGPHLLATARRP
ncbi:MAG: class I SAM-dependent methyltransferase, partial [Planctomycetota bacterium]